MPQETNTLKPRLLTVRQFTEEFPAFSNGSIRHLIFNAKTNGFNKCVKRVGRRVLIDENAFFTWVEDQNMEGV